MNIVLDTQVTLWMLASDKRLTASARELLSSNENQIYYSPVSVLEIATKHSERPHRLSIDENTFNIMCQKSGLMELPLRANSVVAMQGTYADPDDRDGDPFSHLILAQAMDEGMLFMTHNKDLAKADDEHIFYI